jgi:hypothetical protein
MEIVPNPFYDRRFQRRKGPKEVNRNLGCQGSRAVQSGKQLKTWMKEQIEKKFRVISSTEYRRILNNQEEKRNLYSRPFAVSNYTIKGPKKDQNHQPEKFRCFFAIRIPLPYEPNIAKWYLIHGQRQTTNGSVDKKLDYFVNVMNNSCKTQKVWFVLFVQFEEKLFSALAPAVAHHQAKLHDRAKLLFSFCFKDWLEYICQ